MLIIHDKYYDDFVDNDLLIWVYGETYNWIDNILSYVITDNGLFDEY